MRCPQPNQSDRLGRDLSSPHRDPHWHSHLYRGHCHLLPLQQVSIRAILPLKMFTSKPFMHYSLSSFKRNLRRSAPVKIVEAPVRAYLPTSLPPGSIHGGTMGRNGQMSPSIADSDGRALYDWQESTIPIDAQSYRSYPNHG